MKKYASLFLAIFLFAPFSALAHGAHGTGLMAGFTHPVFGLDHRMAIFGLGFLAYRLLPQRQWMPSLVFMVAMIAGSLLGVNANALGMTELAIVSSVFIFGILMAMEVRWPVWAFAGLAAIFGFFHGHAHGVEMPLDTSIPLYILGFSLGASTLSAIGMALAWWLNDPIQPRLVGAFIAGMGLMMYNGGYF